MTKRLLFVAACAACAVCAAETRDDASPAKVSAFAVPVSVGNPGFPYSAGGEGSKLIDTAALIH